VVDPLSGITIGDTICTNSGSITTDVLDITSNTLTVLNAVGFGTGNLIHPGSNWASIIYTDIYKIDNIYDYDNLESLTLNNATGLGTGKYLVQSGTTKATITSIGSGTSNVIISISNDTGTFTKGLQNIHQVETDSETYEPLYNLVGNIEDFTTNYLIQYDENDELRYFVNKLDISDTGSLDASPELNDVGYTFVFNTTQLLDKDNIIIGLQYGTQDLVLLDTILNTKYETKLKTINPIYNGTTIIVLSDKVTGLMSNGTTTITGIVYSVETGAGQNYVTIRHNGIWSIPTGTSNNIMYGDTWNGTGTNRITNLIYSTPPTDLIYFYTGTTNYLAKVELDTGDVFIKRALNTTVKTITTGTYGGASINYSNKTIRFEDSSDFINPGGTSAATLTVWNNEIYQWVTWEYTENILSGTSINTLKGVNSIPATIKENMLAIQDTDNEIKRIEFTFKNKIDKLKLGNRSLFYSSNDLINTIET
jgi:hypothetical protein